MMAVCVSWILTFICLAGCPLSSASPVLRSALVVPAGHNVSLSCNLTSSGDVTWYLLHQQQLLPLLSVTATTLRKRKQKDPKTQQRDEIKDRVEDVTNIHTEDARFSSEGDLEDGTVRLKILQVEQKDAGLYFCTGRCEGKVCVNRGIHLVVDGADGESSRQPCLSLGICVLPPLLLLCLVFIVGFCLCTGKASVCCCNRVKKRTNQPEEISLHYSSLKHAGKPRPSGRGDTGLVEKDVTYSAVMTRKNPTRSHDHK
ncbi:uncharacterized protein LOC131985069 [Centropristis striata]|uniref:uncharacterized protein LOC131985069 n=1 Tax=Centropristis striata TaxID=184440 RepID=UPI0027DFBC2E|nr:uncharacterized protein LOC131985069 [Centropristis striata]